MREEIQLFIKGKEYTLSHGPLPYRSPVPGPIRRQLDYLRRQILGIAKERRRDPWIRELRGVFLHENDDFFKRAFRAYERRADWLLLYDSAEQSQQRTDRLLRLPPVYFSPWTRYWGFWQVRDWVVAEIEILKSKQKEHLQWKRAQVAKRLLVLNRKLSKNQIQPREAFKSRAKALRQAQIFRG